MTDASNDENNVAVFQRQLWEDVAYLDEEWIRDLRFRTRMTMPEEASAPSGIYTVTGFAGAGSTNVVFRAISPSGKDVALTLTRRSLSFPSFIRELPPGLDVDVEFDTARLERKLDRLKGVAAVDAVVDAYRRLYASIVDNLHDWPPFQELTWEDDSVAAAMTLGVKMPGTRAKVVQLASSSQAATAEWASATLASIDELTVNPNTENVYTNPLYIWGGAVMEGYFADDVSVAVRQVTSRLQAHRDDIDMFMTQAWAIANLLEIFHITDQYRAFWTGINRAMEWLDP